MADVLLAYVRDDAAQAEALAEAFDALGFSLGDAHADERELRTSGARVIVWSLAASRSPQMVRTAQEFIAAGDALIASLIEPGVSRLGDVPVFDLSSWRGETNCPRLDPLLDVVRRMVIVTRPQEELAAPTVSEPALAEESSLLSDAHVEALVLAPPAPTRLARRPRRRTVVSARVSEAWVADVPAAPLHVRRTPAVTPPGLPAWARPRRGLWGATAAAAAVAFLGGVLLSGDVSFDRHSGGPVATVHVPEAAAAVIEAPQPRARHTARTVADALAAGAATTASDATPVVTRADYVPPPVAAWTPHKDFALAAQPQAPTEFALIPTKLLEEAAPAEAEAPIAPAAGPDVIAN